MDSTPSTSAHTGELTTSRRIACTKCRQVKLKCDRNTPICSRCREKGLECSYEEIEKIQVTRENYESLKQKAALYDALVSKSPEHDQSQIFASDSDDDSEDEQPMLETFNRNSLVKVSSNFKGPGSSDTFIRTLRTVFGSCGDDTSLDAQSNFYEPSSIRSRRTFSSVQVRLPLQQRARLFFEAQYNYIGTIFSFTNPKESFEHLLQEVYSGTRTPDINDREECLRYAKFLIILALGKMYQSNQYTDYGGPPGFEYFKDALRLLPDPHEDGSILSIEVFCLVGYFFQNMHQRSKASSYLGMALNMAISLGLHQEVPSLDDESREHRRRVWWSLYSLDLILSIKSGNPITILDGEIGVQLPSTLPGESDDWPVTVLRHYTQLSLILGEIHTTLYRKAGSNAPKRSGKRLMESVHRISTTLSKWRHELPKALRYPNRHSISRESVSMFSHYYQCINMTVRPLLAQIVQQRLEQIHSGADPEGKERDWTAGLSTSTVMMINFCINGARDVVEMMTIAASKNLVATYGYMDGEHVVSATIVLVMVCAAFPYVEKDTLAMNAGLQLLYDMGDQGNSHMAARYNLLRSILQAQGIETSLSALPLMRPFERLGMTAPTVARKRHAEDDTPSTDTAELAGLRRGSTVSDVPSTMNETTMPGIPTLDNDALWENFLDEDMMTGLDYTLYEEGFDQNLFAGQPVDAVWGMPQLMDPQSLPAHNTVNNSYEGSRDTQTGSYY